MSNRYKLITFDVTNTLLNLRVRPGHQYAQIASVYGIRADPEKLTSAFKICWKDLNASHPNFGAQTAIKSSSDWWQILVGRTFLSAGYKLDAPRLTTVAGHLLQIYNTSAGWDVRPGARDALSWLRRDQRLTLGVISNFDDRLHAVLKNTGLDTFFDFVLASYNVGCCKPQREIFQLALRDAKCSAKEAAHIGDDVHLDYLAARNAGWDSFLLLPETADSQPHKMAEELDLVDREHMISDVQEIKTLVAS